MINRIEYTTLNGIAKILITVLVFHGICPSSLSADNWPQLRGLHSSGVSDVKAIPTVWGDGTNVRWRLALPGPGTSSPIVWGENIYVTCFTGYEWPKEHERKRRIETLKRHLICVNIHTGRIKWTKSLESEHDNSELELTKANVRVHGFATNTPACDARGVYVFYGADGVIAYTHEGQQRWTRSVGTMSDSTGSAASLMLHQGLLLVCAEVESGTMFALDVRNGDVVWQQPWKTWGYATPIVASEGRRSQLLLSHDALLKAVDPKTGKDLWRREGEKGWVHNTMLAAGGGVIYSCSNQRVMAIRDNGSEILWRRRGGSAYSPCMYDDGRVYWVRGSVIHCIDAQLGKEAYVKRLPTTGLNYAAPIKVNGTILLVSREAGAAVIATGAEYRLLSHNRFAEDDSMFDATPAVVEGCLILRSYRFLYCIAQEGPSSP